MLKVFRIILGGLVFFAGSLLIALVACLRPFDNRTALMWAKYIPPLGLKLMGIDVEVRNHDGMKRAHPCVFIANHQHALDLLVHGKLQCVPVTTIGKKEVKYVPFFGLVFWLSGQIFIDRKNRESALTTMNTVAEIVKKRGVSVWMFPEGTRSHGRGLLPFKKGAFHLAVSAQIPLLPIVASTFEKSIDLNRWRPGKVIVEILEPIDVRGKTQDDVDGLIELSRATMAKKIEELDQELLKKRDQP